MDVVTGATGRAGAEVVRALLQRGRTVRAFVRDPDKARALFGDAAEIAVGDLADPEALRAALDGAEHVVLSGPDDPRRMEWEADAVEIAAATGVRRVVRLSTIGAEPGAPVAFWDWHGRAERRLLDSGVPAVVIRSYPYMTNVVAGAAQVAREGRLYAPAGTARIAMIDPRDVGAATAAATTAGPDGAIHVISGPAAITFAEVAAALAAATGQDVEYVDIPDAAAQQAMVEQGLPDFVARQVVCVYAQLRRGIAAPVTTAVESLTGRPPRDFAAFAGEHAHLFAPAAVGTAR